MIESDLKDKGAFDFYYDLLFEAIEQCRKHGQIFRDWQVTPELIEKLMRNGASNQDIRNWALNISLSPELLKIFDTMD